MNRFRRLSVGLCAVASFAGGAVASRVFRASASADAHENRVEKVLKAQRFEVVNDEDKVIGYLGTDLSNREFPTLSLEPENTANCVYLNRTGFHLGNQSNQVKIRWDKAKKTYVMEFYSRDTIMWTQP